MVHDRSQIEEYFIVEVEKSPQDESKEVLEQAPVSTEVEKTEVITPPNTPSQPEPKPEIEVKRQDDELGKFHPRPRPEDKTPPPPIVTTVPEEKITPTLKPRPRPKEWETNPPKRVVTPPPTTTTTNISNYKARWDRNSNGSLYTKYTLNALDSFASKLLNATNIQDTGFCPKLNSLSRTQKKQFWLMVISGIARWESGFDPNGKFKESSGRYSRGLLQLDYAHKRAYKCKLTSQYDLHDPQKNLECGVKMITKLVTRDKLIRSFKWAWKKKKNKDGSYVKDAKGQFVYIRYRDWLGAADFWSVLRYEIWSGEKKRNVLTISAETRKLSFCR